MSDPMTRREALEELETWLARPAETNQYAAHTLARVRAALAEAEPVEPPQPDDCPSTAQITHEALNEIRRQVMVIRNEVCPDPVGHPPFTADDTHAADMAYLDEMRGKAKPGWWCPRCGCAVDGQNVTYDERHVALSDLHNLLEEIDPQ